MLTGSWSLYKGPGRIQISVGRARFAPPGYRQYPALYPDRATLHMPIAQYGPIYRAKLAALDPNRTWDELHELDAGAEPVLMCFEKPPFSPVNFCHRRMVADWFMDTLGREVEEHMPAPTGFFAHGPVPVERR